MKKVGTTPQSSTSMTPARTQTAGQGEVQHSHKKKFDHLMGSKEGKDKKQHAAGHGKTSMHGKNEEAGAEVQVGRRQQFTRDRQPAGEQHAEPHEQFAGGKRQAAEVHGGPDARLAGGKQQSAEAQVGRHGQAAGGAQQGAEVHGGRDGQAAGGAQQGAEVHGGRHGQAAGGAQQGAEVHGGRDGQAAGGAQQGAEVHGGPHAQLAGGEKKTASAHTEQTIRHQEQARPGQEEVAAQRGHQESIGEKMLRARGEITAEGTSERDAVDVTIIGGSDTVLPTTRIATSFSTASTPVSGTTGPVEINRLIEKTVSRILVSSPESGQNQEVRLQLDGRLLGGTEVRLHNSDSGLQIEFFPQTVDSGNFLSQQRSHIQQRLSRNLKQHKVAVTINHQDAKGSQAAQRERRVERKQDTQSS